MKVEIGEVDSEIDSTIGVRQGSCEDPVLFLFIMQAAMETLEWPEGVSKPELMTREYGKTTGELELELIQTQMTQKPMLRAEVYARALRASQNRKEDSL